MLNLIYRNHELNFDSLFMDNVHAYDAKKLNFNTREEYLNWVKQWKEDMKTVALAHTRYKLYCKRDHCERQEKKNRHQARLNKLPELNDVQNARLEVLKNSFLVDYNLKPYFYCTHYLVWYLLVLRKAAKIKANAQRALRLQAVA